MICTNCGALLMDEERYYYADRCNDCEVAWHARVERWRRGGDDPELSKMFGNEQEGHA